VGPLPLRFSTPVLTAVALVSVHLALSFIWVLQHDLPTGGRDEFFIVEVVTDIAYRIAEGDWAGVHRYLFDNAYYPPLVRLPGVVALLLGGSYSALVLSGWVWLPFLLIPTWLIGRRISGTPWGGTGALALLLAAPGFADCLHHYESNLGPMAMTACCFLAWLHSDHFTRSRFSLAFGLFLGLGLLSDRLGVLPFVLVPGLVSLLVTRSRRTLTGLALVASATAVTAGWWYLGFFSRFGAELLPQLLHGEIDRSGALLDQGSSGLGFWLHYLLLWPDTQLGLVAGMLALGGLLLAAFSRERRLALLLSWVLGGLFLFTLSQKRQVYYTLPLLPLAAVLGSNLLVRLRERCRRSGPAIVLAVVFVVQVPAVLGLHPEWADFAPGLRSWLLLNQSPLSDEAFGARHPLGRSPAPSGLDLQETVANLRRATGDAHPELVVFSSSDAQVTEHYQVVLGRIALGTLDLHGLTTHPEGFLQGLHSPDALLFVHRGGADWPQREQLIAAHESYDRWLPHFEGLLELLGEWRAGAELLEVQQLADGEQLSVWRLSP